MNNRDTKLKDFYYVIMVRFCGLAESVARDIIDNEEYFETLKKAFNHKSVFPELDDNYDPFEFIGDRVVNLATVIYLTNVLETRNMGILTNCMQKVVSQQGLSRLLEKMNVIEHILIDYGRLPKNVSPQSVYEDVFEAIAGVLQEVYRKYISSNHQNEVNSIALASSLAVEFVLNVLQCFPPELSDDPAMITPLLTQIKEIYESNVSIARFQKLHEMYSSFNSNMALKDIFGTAHSKQSKRDIVFTRLEGNTYTSIVYVEMLESVDNYGHKKYQRRELSKASDLDMKASEAEALRTALQKLYKEYGISYPIKDVVGR